MDLSHGVDTNSMHPITEFYPCNDKKRNRDKKYVPVNIKSETIGIAYDEFVHRHSALYNRVSALHDMITHLKRFIESLEYKAEVISVTHGSDYESDKDIDSEKFLQAVAVLSHISDVSRDALTDAIRTAGTTYLIPATVIAPCADRSDVTLSRSILHGADYIDKDKRRRPQGWSSLEVPDYLELVRERYGFSGGRAAMSRKRDGSVLRYSKAELPKGDDGTDPSGDSED